MTKVGEEKEKEEKEKEKLAASMPRHFPEEMAEAKIKNEKHVSIKFPV